MNNTNKVELDGTLGKDPIIKYVGAKNTELAEFSIAVNEDGANNQKKTMWVNCKAWKYTALVAMDHLHKGDFITVKGKLSIETWKDKATGQNRSRAVVVVMQIQKTLKPKGTAAANAHTTDPVSDDEPPDPEDTPF